MVETLSCDFLVPPSEDSCPEGSIDLKCKERVSDSDEDESDGQVAALLLYLHLIPFTVFNMR